MSRAIPHLRLVKSYAEQSGKVVYKMKAYRDLGTCYQLIRRYQIALIYFKKQLELAWYHNNMELELEAYDRIGRQYYYLGNLDKAVYYNNRAWKGIVEPKDSPARLLAANTYEARRKPRLNLNINGVAVRPDSGNSSNLSDSELPSPINISTKVGKPQVQYREEQVKLPVLRQKTGSVQQSVEEHSMSFVLISHLSLNRSLKNYQCMKDAKKVKRRTKPLAR